MSTFCQINDNFPGKKLINFLFPAWFFWVWYLDFSRENTGWDFLRRLWLSAQSGYWRISGISHAEKRRENSLHRSRQAARDDNDCLWRGRGHMSSPGFERTLPWGGIPNRRVNQTIAANIATEDKTSEERSGKGKDVRNLRGKRPAYVRSSWPTTG